jgi:hypothetical protein
MASTFDGVNKIITLDAGDTLLIKELYKEWIHWLPLSDNSKYLPAFRTAGGDTIGDNQNIAPYYFLTNGWKIRPYEGDHFLTVIGNLFVDGGGNPFIPTIGSYNVTISLNVSSDSKVTTVAVGSGVTEQDKIDIVGMVWAELLTGSSTPDSAAYILKKIRSIVNDNQALILSK